MYHNAFTIEINGGGNETSGDEATFRTASEPIWNDKFSNLAAHQLRVVVLLFNVATCVPLVNPSNVSHHFV